MRRATTEPGPTPSDESLMERYAAGDEGAFDALFHRYEARAYAFFLRRTGSPDRARDLYQELFLRIHRARARYDAGRPFAPWFFRIAQRLLVDDHRRAFRSHEVPIDRHDVRRGAPAPADLVVAREEIGQLLGALSADERYVLLSAKVQGVGYPELARRLGKSADAVKKMASRAVQRLRRLEAADPQS